jgi:hypothetical protein
MKTARLAVLAAVAGFITGIVLSEVIGILGVLLFDRAIGIKYLPVYLALAGAVGLPVLARRQRRGNRS